MDADVIYIDFADLTGSYDHVVVIVQCLLGLDGYLVRLDGFTRFGCEIHRIYFTDYEMYDKLASQDSFALIGKAPVLKAPYVSFVDRSMIRAAKRRAVDYTLIIRPDYKIKDGHYFVRPHKHQSLQTVLHQWHSRGSRGHSAVPREPLSQK